MSQDRSHLVPTPTVDKNGVLTTRHRKPTVSQGAKTAIPVVSIGAKKQSYEEGSVEHLATLIYGISDPQWTSALNSLKDDDASNIGLAIKLLTSGESQSRNLVRSRIAEAVDEISGAKNKPRRFGAPATQEDANVWRSRSPDLTSPYFKHTLLSIWNASEITEEAGSHLRVKDMVDDMYDLDDFIDVYSSNEYRRENNDYWRGLAIIVAADIMVGADRIDDAEPFALWASKQPNAGQIIELVKERDTLNTEVISGIAAEQKNTSIPLRKGTL